jgi:CHRD domain
MKAIKGMLIGTLLGTLVVLGAPSSAVADKAGQEDRSGQELTRDPGRDDGGRQADNKRGDGNADKKHGGRRDGNDHRDAAHDRDDADYYYDGYYYGPGDYGDYGYCGYYGGCGYYNDDGSSTSTFYARMTGDQEAPKPGPPGARGTAQFDMNPAEHRMCFRLNHQGIGRPTAAHIHRGDPGHAGPVAVDLHIDQVGDQGCVPAGYGVVRAIQADPHGFYVNIHTADFPDGAMRGQLYSPGESY